MGIYKATLSDFDDVFEITAKTILDVYPHYYPKGAVEFFLEHHTEKNILNDIRENRVFICKNNDGATVGTVTLKENEICRLFVLPEYQGNGYGRELIEFAEDMIFREYEKVRLAASFSAKMIYLKRGYRECGTYYIKTEYDDFLCYDEMEKKI